MTEKDLRKAYVRACQTKGFEPSEGQFKTWKQTMMFFDAADIERGIDLWYQQETALPMPAELRPFIERARRMRTNQSSEQRFLVVWICRTCGHRRSGFLTMDDRGARFCSSKWGPLLPIDAPRINGQRPERVQFADGQTCGAELEIVTDDRLVTA